jgi:hypothetical protein
LEEDEIDSCTSGVLRWSNFDGKHAITMDEEAAFIDKVP